MRERQEKRRIYVKRVREKEREIKRERKEKRERYFWLGFFIHLENVSPVTSPSLVKVLRFDLYSVLMAIEL